MLPFNLRVSNVLIYRRLLVTFACFHHLSDHDHILFLPPVDNGKVCLLLFKISLPGDFFGFSSDGSLSLLVFSACAARARACSVLCSSTYFHLSSVDVHHFCRNLS